MPEYGRGGRGGGYGMGGGMKGGRGGGRFSGGGNEDHLDPEHEQYRKLFVGGLSYETSTEGLKGHFEKHGEIVDCVVMKDPHTKRSRGFGFVTFKEAAMLDDAQENRPHKIDGRETETKRAMPREILADLHVDRARHLVFATPFQPNKLKNANRWFMDETFKVVKELFKKSGQPESGRSESQQSVTKLFIGGCKDDTTEDHLRDTFSPFGEIEKIDLIQDRTTGKTKGFSFVTFKDYDSVDKCVLKKVHNLNGRNVEVKKAENKEEKAARAARGGGMMGQGWGGEGFGGQGFGRGQGGFGGGGFGGRSAYGGGYGNQGGYGGGGGGNYNGNWGSAGYDSGYGGGYSQGGGGGGGGGNWGGASGGGDFGSSYGGNSYGAGYGSGGGGGGASYSNSNYGGGGGGTYSSGGSNYGGGGSYGNSNYSGGGAGNYGGYNRR